MSEPQVDNGRTVRELVRRRRKATLATLLPEARDFGPAPYASLVMVAADTDASPLLLLSELAVHTRNLREDPRAALLFDGTDSLANPLTGERATLLGSLEPVSCERMLARYLRFHPEATQYRGFADFGLYRMDVTRAHLVAGFGRIGWLPADAVLLPRAVADALGEVEAELLRELDREQADNLQILAAGEGASPGGWRAVGLDPEGLDLAREQERLRIAFPTTVTDTEGLRGALLALLRCRRQQPEEHSS